jgi:hypothetical protein
MNWKLYFNNKVKVYDCSKLYRMWLKCGWLIEFRLYSKYRDAANLLVRTEMNQATATEDFDIHISYLLSQLEEY